MDPMMLISNHDIISVNVNSLKSKVNELIENTYNIFDKRSQVIKKELDGLRKDYQEQLLKINDYFINLSDSNLKKSQLNMSKSTISRSPNNYPINLNYKNKSPNNPSRNSCKKFPTVTIHNNKKEIVSPLNFKKFSNKDLNCGFVVNNKNGSKEKLNLKNKKIFDYSTNLTKNNYSTNTSPIVKLNYSLTKSIEIRNKTSENENLNLRDQSPTTPSITELSNEKEKKMSVISNFNSKDISISDNELELKFKNIKDERKFSILDVGCINSFNYVKKEKSNIRSDYKFVKSLDIKNKYLQAFYILASSNIVPYNQRILFASLNKQISSHLTPSVLKTDYIKFINKKIEIIENEISDNKISNEYLNSKINPSKTAQINMNFVTKKTEEDFRNSNDKDIQNILKIICLILKEEYDDRNSNFMENFFLNIIPKYKVDNLKVLIFNVIYRNLNSDFYISINQINKIKEIIETNPIIIKPSEMMKKNFAASCLTFSIKEIYEFTTMTNPMTGEYLYQWRLKFSYIQNLKSDLEKLSKKE